MLRDIEGRKIDAVAFQHALHLSRSDTHFSELINFFMAHGVSYFFLCNPAKEAA